MHDLSSTAGIVAIAAGAVAVLAFLLAATLGWRLRALRSEQRILLGDGRRDLVSHAASLQSHFEALTRYVDEAAASLDARMSAADQRLDGTIAYRSLIRYDAYGEMSGRQSTSIALLDAHRSGIVLSSIHHRDTARLYAKQVHEGRPEIELSPEEDEAVRSALAGSSGMPASA